MLGVFHFSSLSPIHGGKFLLCSLIPISCLSQAASGELETDLKKIQQVCSKSMFYVVLITSPKIQGKFYNFL